MSKSYIQKRIDPVQSLRYNERRTGRIEATERMLLFDVPITNLNNMAMIIVGAGMASGGKETIETIEYAKAEMLKRMDILRSTLSDYNKSAAHQIDPANLEPHFGYYTELYKAATRYTDAKSSDMQRHYKRELKDFIIQHDPSGIAAEMIQKLADLQPMTPADEAIMLYHAEYWKKPGYKKYREMEHQFVLWVARNPNATNGQLEAVNAIKHNALPKGEHWRRVTDKHRHKKLPVNTGSF